MLRDPPCSSPRHSPPLPLRVWFSAGAALPGAGAWHGASGGEEATRPGPCPSPAQQSSSGPASGLSFTRVATLLRLAPVGRGARVTSLGGGTGSPQGHPRGCRVEPHPRWECPGQQAGDFLIPGILPGHGEQGWVLPLPSPPPRYTHTEAQVTDANLLPSHVLPVPPCGHGLNSPPPPLISRAG